MGGDSERSLREKFLRESSYILYDSAAKEKKSSFMKRRISGEKRLKNMLAWQCLAAYLAEGA